MLNSLNEGRSSDDLHLGSNRAKGCGGFKSRSLIHRRAVEDGSGASYGGVKGDPATGSLEHDG
jgi:hypothetical protein